MGSGLVTGGIYRSKIVRVYAWQFFKGHIMPDWVRNAMQVKDKKIIFKRGPVAYVEPNQGDWIVRDSMGNVSVFTADEFQGAFEADEPVTITPPRQLLLTGEMIIAIHEKWVEAGCPSSMLMADEENKQ